MDKKSSSETKSKILKITGGLFAKRGYFGVSMQDIADQLSISKTAIYYHFASKEELAKILMRNSVDELKKELKQSVNQSNSAADLIFRLIKTFLDFKIKHPEITLIHSLGLSNDQRLPIVQFVLNLRKEIIKFIRELVENLDFLRQFTSRTLSILIISLLSFVLSPIQNTPKNTKQLAQDFTTLIFSDPSLKNK